jgi:hypothetical protein
MQKVSNGLKKFYRLTAILTLLFFATNNVFAIIDITNTPCICSGIVTALTELTDLTIPVNGQNVQAGYFHLMSGNYDSAHRAYYALYDRLSKLNAPLCNCP